MKKHSYSTSIIWTGNSGSGTKGYNSYKRDHIIKANGKPEIAGSSDPSFMGDSSKYNPEELFLASLSACHMLWYLHLCSNHHITVVYYSDEAEATLIEEKDGSGKFDSVTLHPVVTITQSKQIDTARAIHNEANRMCFIANSCAVSVLHKPIIKVEPPLN